MTTIFKTETRKIRDMRNVLKIHQKLNGTQVILSNPNKDKMQEVVELLSKASNILETIN